MKRRPCKRQSSSYVPYFNLEHYHQLQRLSLDSLSQVDVSVSAVLIEQNQKHCTAFRL
jgi:hypothetical protein